MDDSDSVEFDMPLQLRGHLGGDPQFEGMHRRFRISRAAIDKATEVPMPTVPAEDLWEEFWLDVAMQVRDDVWSRAPTDGVVTIGRDDIRDAGERLF